MEIESLYESPIFLKLKTLKLALDERFKAVVLGGLWWMSLSNGFSYGQMTGMISALQKHDEGIYLSENEIYWIATSMTTICLAGFLYVAAIADRIGRRWSFITSSTLMTINWIILFIAKDMFMFMISRITGGIAMGALTILTICVTSEYTSTSNRGFYLNMMTTVSPAIGTGLGHVLGIIMHWRNVVLLGILFSTISTVLPYFWVESPHWLASRGMFTECEESFRKLHGKKIEKELRTLIKLEDWKLNAERRRNSRNAFKKLLLAFNKRYFWELMVLSAVIYAYMAAAGKVTFSILATIMIEDITGTSEVLTFTLLVDGLIILGSVLSCVLIRRMSMRNMLFLTGFIANAVLVILSACLYFKNNELYFQWINVSLLALYFIIINAGPYPISEVLMSEMFPLEIKFYCIFFSGLTLIGFLSLSVMLFPLIVASIGYYGLFLLNVVIMSLSLGYIWIRLPETKGRTLQEIEVYFKTKGFDVDEAVNNAQMKLLI